MKRLVCMVLLAGMLAGCTAEETLETVNDEWIVPVMAQPREISVRLPDDAMAPVLEQENQRLYIAKGYEIMVETLASGDLNETIRSLSGYGKDQVTLFRTRQGDTDRYDFVWTAIGEQGDRLGRAVVLDDGEYHYCMSVLRDAGKSQVIWRDVFQSFTLI